MEIYLIDVYNTYLSLIIYNIFNKSHASCVNEKYFHSTIKSTK